jgi:hypothetical protein
VTLVRLDFFTPAGRGRAAGSGLAFPSPAGRGRAAGSGLLLVLAVAGCAHRVPIDAQVRARVALIAAALDTGKLDAIDPFVASTSARDRQRRAAALGPELAAVATRLRNTSLGTLDLRARVHLAGPIGAHVALDRDPGGWRIDPDSIGVDASSPRAAVEQLVAALERLETDPGLALLTGELRGEVVRNARARTAGLRELAARLPAIDAAHAGWPLDLDYGQGLFVRLRSERGQWRVDDFN